MTRQYPAGDGGPDIIVEKEMGLRLDEFHRSMRHLVEGLNIAPGQVVFQLDLGAFLGETPGISTIEISAGEEYLVRLSPLVNMPRRRIALRFTNPQDGQDTRFLARFDKAFQRGGG